jgi:hypothetical protein
MIGIYPQYNLEGQIMSSSEQYVFQDSGSQSTDSRPNLLPSEFQWQPSTTSGATGRVDNTAGQVGNSGIVPNNSGIVDSSGGYVTDNGGTYVPGSNVQTGTDTQSYNTTPYAPTETQGQTWVPQGVDQPSVVPVQQGDGSQVAPQPAAGQDSAPRSVASSGDSNGGSGHDPMWWLDRGTSLASTGLTASLIAPNLKAFIPEGANIPTLESLRSIPKGEWGNAVRTDLGKAMGGAWLADTVLDSTFLKDRETSWKTMAVDIATPFIASRLLPGMGLLKTIGITMGAHAAEKLFFEDKKDS